MIHPSITLDKATSGFVQALKAQMNSATLSTLNLPQKGLFLKP